MSLQNFYKIQLNLYILDFRLLLVKAQTNNNKKYIFKNKKFKIIEMDQYFILFYIPEDQKWFHILFLTDIYMNRQHNMKVYLFIFKDG